MREALGKPAADPRSLRLSGRYPFHPAGLCPGPHRTPLPVARCQGLQAGGPRTIQPMKGEATLNAVELFVGLVAIAALVALVARRIAVPYTVALVVFGLGGALVAPRVGFGITGELVLAVLLPGLIFEAAYQTDLGSFRRAFGGIALLAAPGVLITAAIVALVLQWTVQLPFELGFVVGAMVAATDPAAVVSTFKRLQSPKRLAALVEGESLLNDGTALVVFAIVLRAVTSEVSAPEAHLAQL